MVIFLTSGSCRRGPCKFLHKNPARSQRLVNMHLRAEQSLRCTALCSQLAGDCQTAVERYLVCQPRFWTGKARRNESQVTRRGTHLEGETSSVRTKQFHAQRVSIASREGPYIVAYVSSEEPYIMLHSQKQFQSEHSMEAEVA